MRVILHLLILAILAVSFSGCFFCPEPPKPPVIVKYKYIKQPVPKLQKKPDFKGYNVILVQFKDSEFYAIPRVDGAVMSSNWENYKAWAEANYKILKELESDYNSTK